MDRAEEDRILTAAQARLDAKRKALGIGEPSLRPLRFFVPGKPCSKGSPAILRNRSTGKPFVREKPTEISWEESIRVVAGVAKRKEVFALLLGPVAVRLEFVLPRRKGCTVDAVLRASMKPHPDADKLARAALDALAGVLYVDDCQVTELGVRKAVGERPGVWIEVARDGGAQP
jgi:Holliday junction resolvase RusA-like endonuclease